MSKYLFLSLIAIRAITTSALPHLPNSTSSIENTYISQHMIKRGLLSPLTDLGNNLIGKGKPTFIILKKRNEKTRKKNNESVSFNTRAFCLKSWTQFFFNPTAKPNPRPDVHLDYGNFIGINDDTVDSFTGIPFVSCLCARCICARVCANNMSPTKKKAEPPIGDRRLRESIPPLRTYPNFDASVSRLSHSKKKN